MAQGFTGGFIRGLGLGLILLGALSIYVGPRGPQSGKTDTPSVPVASLPQDEKQTPTEPQSATEPTVTDAAATDQATVPQSAPEAPTTITPPLPQDPVISAQEAPTPNVAQPQIPQGNDGTDTPADQADVAMPDEPDTDGTALPDLDRLVVIEPDNAIPPAAINVPRDPEDATPALPVPAAPRLAPRPTPETGEIDTDYAPIEAPQSFDIETIDPNTGDPFAIDRAINLHATDPQIVDGRPLVAVALVADQTINLSQLEDLGFPVAIVLSADHPDATPWSEALRRKNQEVIIALDLSVATTVQDIETNLAAVLAQTPKTIAVMEQTAGSLQQSRLHNEAVPDILARTGHGLITYRNGLNTIQKNARASNLRVGIITENLTDLSQSAIERRLERVLLEATKPGNPGALIVAPLSGEILDTLSDWTEQERTQRIQVVPVSQYLTLISQE